MVKQGKEAATEQTVAMKPPALVSIADVKTEKIRWLWYPYIPRGKLTSIEGDPGLGKSWITTVIATAISGGNPLPNQDNGSRQQKVLLLSAEDGLGDTIRPRLEALGARLENIIALDEPITLDERGLPRLEQAIKKVRPAVVFIDPLVAYAGGKMDMHRANQVRVLMRALAQLAENFGCAIVTVRHLRKSRGGAAIYQGQGSIDITAACRSVLMVGMDNDKRVIAHAKCNLARLGPSLAFEIEDSRFQWMGPVKTTADDLAAEPEDRATHSAIEAAKDFLREALSEGPVSSNELNEQAKEMGLSARTLMRARHALGAKAVQKEGHWTTSLPPENEKDREPKYQGQKVGSLAA